jgi:hypothetical protein
VGLSATRLKLFVFAYTGFLTAVATLVDVPRLPKIEAGIGSGFELLVVTCVVVGGVSISGGRGKLRGVLLAVDDGSPRADVPRHRRRRRKMDQSNSRGVYSAGSGERHNRDSTSRDSVIRP